MAPNPGIDGRRLRLAILGVLVVMAFVALFSRLWFLQVLASDEYRVLAKENRVRRVTSEPPRGDILDKNGKVLVDSRESLAVAIDRQVLSNPRKKHRILERLSELLDIEVEEFRARLKDKTVSPYKPIAIANDVEEDDVTYIKENEEDFPGVEVEKIPIRKYPHGALGAHILGYVGEISEDLLKSDHFKNVRPIYTAGDIVGRAGIEYSYDRYLRGRPAITKVIVNSTGDVIRQPIEIQEEEAGNDLVLSLDAEVQALTENALADGIAAARSHFQAPAGAVVVMEPQTGRVVALASNPSYDPTILADGITTKEFASLGQATPENPDDDSLLDRAIQAQRQPGSTFKVVTAGAALALGIIDPYAQLECPGSKIYPPEGGPGTEFNNWTSAYNGYLSIPESLEQSCDTFYYELGWRMEDAFGFGTLNGDETERFQKYARTAGLGHETGIDLPNELPGRIPDNEWCQEAKKEGFACPYNWLPGYTVNMAIGQGDVITTPLQMAVTYAAIANGGTVWEPRIGYQVVDRTDEGETEVIKELAPKVAARLPLDDVELGMIQDGLVDVISGAEGTARGAFAGFPLAEFPLAGKTGTAELGETDLNDAWFVSYGPVDDPQYVIAVYVEKAGHGGESAAPIARQIWEGIFGIDKDTGDVQLGQDFSG